MQQPGEAASTNPLEGSKIDYKRIISRAFRYWYLVVLSLLISLSYAFFKNCMPSVFIR